jgi:heme oxygenase
MDFSEIRTVPASLGCMYVLEGSTLGSQILSRSFKERFGIADHNGGAFFYGYGELTVSMWRRFGTELEKWFQEHESSGDEVVAGADWMFRKAAEQLTGEKL